MSDKPKTVRLDPAMQSLLDQMAAVGAPPDFAAMGPAAAREYGKAANTRLRPGPIMARTEQLEVAGHEAKLPATLFVPEGEIGGLIVFYHGGGWVVGSIEGYAPVCQLLAQTSGCAVLSVGYRLAPEHPFPIPAEDCYAATVWAGANLDKLIGARLPLVVAGDSAGGNLAAVVALLARDRGGPQIACQLLVFPATDCDLDKDAYRRYGTGGMLTAATMRWFWDLYVEDPALRSDPRVSCLRATSLAGLPPAMVEIATHDPLRDDGEQYADRLAEEGTKTVMRRWYGLCHGFFQLATILPPAGDAVRRMGADLREMLAGLAAA